MAETTMTASGARTRTSHPQASVALILGGMRFGQVPDTHADLAESQRRREQSEKESSDEAKKTN